MIYIHLYGSVADNIDHQKYNIKAVVDKLYFTGRQTQLSTQIK